MEKKTDIFGIGPKFAALSILYTIVVFLIYRIYFSNLKFVIVHSWVNLALGLFLIGVGLVIFVLSIIAVSKHFTEGKLYTKGVYAFVRHPMYSAWILYIVPGMVLISGSLLGLTVPLVMYAIFKKLIVEEEKALEEQFGKAYVAYKNKVGAVFPNVKSILAK